MARDDAETVLHEQLAIVSNDMFKHLAEHATPVNAHTAIDNDTKTVKPGALWYEETLPPDTLLYIALVASCSRKPVQDKKNGKSAEKVLKHIENLFADYSYLQVGGNETVGMGWCHLKILRGSNHATDHATTTS
ncbi:MAG: RAMP superfamily CRISPR-associated protein, partial [Pseudomonadota bacterium]|nr:RAMP superfamily CRISPR-associated protein [Pseudomonadota bacterium]